MKTAFVLLTFFFAIAFALDRLSERALLQKSSCPSYTGPSHLQGDAQIEITYLNGVPDEALLAKYSSLLALHSGAVFGKAIVHFSSPLPFAVRKEHFRVTRYSGEIIGIVASPDDCDVEVDFVVKTSCYAECRPLGICLEIDSSRIKEDTGHVIPLRKDCRFLSYNERPRCLYASWTVLDMAESENDVVAYTSKTEARLMVLLKTPYPSFLDFKPEDFTVSGPEGTVIESVTAAKPGDAANVAYTLAVKHGASTDDVEMRICLVGTAALEATVLSYQTGEGICASYTKTAEESIDPVRTFDVYTPKVPKICPRTKP